MNDFVIFYQQQIVKLEYELRQAKGEAERQSILRELWNYQQALGLRHENKTKDVGIGAVKNWADEQD